MALVGWLSSLPGGQLAPAFAVPHLDKLAHGMMYALLVLSFHPGRRARLQPPEWLPLATVTALVFAASDELHQAWVPERSPQVLDWVADAIGALGAGWACRRRWLQKITYRIIP